MTSGCGATGPSGPSSTTTHTPTGHCGKREPTARGTPASACASIASLEFDLDQAGGYRWQGPVVRVHGIWHFHDVDRGGESYLEVASFEVVQPARQLEDPAFWPLWLVGIGLVLGAYYLYWRKDQETAPSG